MVGATRQYRVCPGKRADCQDPSEALRPAALRDG